MVKVLSCGTWKPFRGTIQLAFPWIPRTSWKFHGEFSWIPRPSWIPWKFRGIHENFVDSMKTSWSPWKLRGLHENFVESMEISWIPWKLRGFHENFVETMNNRGFHEIPWMPWKSMDSTNSLKLMGPHGIEAWIVGRGSKMPPPSSKIWKMV